MTASEQEFNQDELCELAADLLKAAGLPEVVRDLYGRYVVAGFRTEHGAGPKSTDFGVRISHKLPDEDWDDSNRRSNDQRRWVQVTEVATYRGVLLAAGWTVQLKHTQLGPFILAVPNNG